jgi:hypothetical protein
MDLGRVSRLAYSNALWLDWTGMRIFLQSIAKTMPVVTAVVFLSTQNVGSRIAGRRKLAF